MRFIVQFPHTRSPEELALNIRQIAEGLDDGKHTPRLEAIQLLDGLTAPLTATGFALLYVDVADGSLRVKFGDGYTAIIQSGAA